VNWTREISSCGGGGGETAFLPVSRLHETSYHGGGTVNNKRDWSQAGRRQENEYPTFLQ